MSDKQTAARASGWQDDGSYVPCPSCLYEPPAHDGPGVRIGDRPGVTVHDRHCEEVSLPFSPEAAEGLRADLAAIAEAERQAWLDMRDVVIGG